MNTNRTVQRPRLANYVADHGVNIALVAAPARTMADDQKEVAQSLSPGASWRRAIGYVLALVPLTTPAVGL
jgi:hypothetical protein